MKIKKFSPQKIYPQQVANILKEYDNGKSVAEIIRDTV